MEAADGRGTNQLHGWVLQEGVSREALAAGKQLTDDCKAPNAGRDRAVTGTTRPMHSMRRKKESRRKA